MTSLSLTRHAEARSNQRGIRRETIKVLMDFGICKYRSGAQIIFMNNSSRRSAKKLLGRKVYARLERALDTYLVVADDGQVMTCAHRKQPLRFDN